MRPKKKVQERRRPMKKISFKRKRDWNFSNGITNTDLANINNVLHAHKSQLAEGKSSWKVVPKDSCEVYKERRKRKAENENKKLEEENSDGRINIQKKKVKRSSGCQCQYCRKKRSGSRRDSHSSDASGAETESSYSNTEEMDY